MQARRMTVAARGALNPAILARLIGAMTLTLIGWSPAAMAARPNSINIYYMDGQDNIIGESIAYCNNVAEHAGTTAFDNPYTITFSGSCDISQSPTLGITHFSSATGKTVDYLCNQDHPAGTPFAGFPGCDQSSPLRDIDLSPWIPGGDF